MTDLWWRGNVCHDVTNCHADVSRSVAVMCSDQGVGVTQQRTDQYHQITTHNWSQIANIFLAFSRHLIIFALTLWKFGWSAQKTNAHRRLLWFMKIQWVTFGSQLGMEFLLLLSDLIINQLFDRGWIFITDGFYLSSSKMYFPAWGWVESIQVWLACLDLKPKLKLSFQYFDISTILQTGDRGL